MTTQPSPDRLDEQIFVLGFIAGLVIGGAITLFKAPRTGREIRQQLLETGDTVRAQLESAVPTDPIADGLAEGKAAARRRRAQLGLN
jgi:gas vesicle protein